MAAWHFDLEIVVDAERRELSAPLGAMLFDAFLSLATFDRHEQYGDVREAWTDQGHQLTFVGGEVESLKVRVDLRVPTEEWSVFVADICQLIRPHGLCFFSECGDLLPAEVGAVQEAARSAPAVAAIEMLKHYARRGTSH